jgi:hypothetical protein
VHVREDEAIVVIKGDDQVVAVLVAVGAQFDEAREECRDIDAVATAKKNELYDPTVIQGSDLDKYLLQDRAEVGALIEKVGLAKM